MAVTLCEIECNDGTFRFMGNVATRGPADEISVGDDGTLRERVSRFTMYVSEPGTFDPHDGEPVTLDPGTYEYEHGQIRLRS